MAKRVSQSSSKKAAKPAGRSGAVARPTARSGKVRTAAASKATSKSRSAVAVAAKPALKSKHGKGTSATRKPAAKAEKPVAKPAGKAVKGKGRSTRIDVKVGGFGGTKPGSFGFNGHRNGVGKSMPRGLSFLAGKPGSVGSSAGLDERPRLTKTKLTPRELRHFRDLLLAKRRQLLGDMDSMENEALRVDSTNLSHLPVHMADMGTDNYEQEFTLSLVDRERKLVDEIDHALRKVDEKTYGICEGTGQMISTERLEAQPWARYGIEYARHLQRPGFRRP